MPSPRSTTLLALALAALPAACGGEGGESANPVPVAHALLDAPTSGQGFQLGTDSFSVPAGQEVQRCYFVEIPSEADVYVGRITLGQEPGSHHLNVFRVKTVKALGGKPGDVVDGGECWKSANWSDWPLVVNSQESQPGKNVVDWKLPDGVAHKFGAHELLMIQSHYVNATTQATPGVGHALVNFWTEDASQVKAELGTVFATNQNIKVCPGDVNRSYATGCNFAKQPVTIVAANGHFHSRGVDFKIAPWDATTATAGETFYESKTWDDPPFVTGLDVKVPALGGIQYTCEFSAPATSCGDPANSCCFTFGGHVETQEHCNAFVYYYPKQDNDQNCF